MIAALGVIVGSVLATALPALPEGRLALETARGVQLRIGFMPDGAALIHFPNGPCEGHSRPVRGIYAVPLHAAARLVLRTPRFAQYAMWGG